MREFGVKAVAAAALVAVAGCAGGPVEDDVGPGFDMLASKNYAAAESYFATEVSEDPDNAYAHLNLGAAHEAQGNYAMAAMHYQHAVDMGEGVPIGKTVYNGQVKMEDTTVAAVAAYNLANLPQ